MVTIDSILDSLYTHCQSRSLKSEEILDLMIKDLKVIVSQIEKEKLLELIRPYKRTSKNLEHTVYAIFNLLNFTANRKDEIDFEL